MAISEVVKSRRDGTITISDLSSAHSLTVAFEAGDLNISVPGPTITDNLDRGQFTSPPSMRYADDQPCTGTFTAQLRDLSDAAYITLESLLCDAGYAASTWVSTLGASAEVNTWTIAWTVEGTNHGDSADHTLTLNYCAISGSLQEGDPNTISISFTARDLYPTLT